MNTFNPFAQPQANELPRDRWGRPLITPPDGGDSTAYTRASTLGKVLDDTYNLGQWMNRMVALGMAKRPDLVLRAAAIDDPDDRGQKKTLQEIADRAKDSAAPSKAELGSAMHQFSERVDKGEPIDIVPPQYRPDIGAYLQTIEDHGLEVVSIEIFVVDDDNQVAGTYDRIYRLTKNLPIPSQLANQLFEDGPVEGPNSPFIHDGGTVYLKAGQHIIGDIKTGSSVVLSAGSFAVQLGTYANGTAYDHSVGSRTDLPSPLTRELAVVLHMPAGKGTCTLYWLNIMAGYNVGLPLTREVRAWRASQKELIAASLIQTAKVPELSLPEQIRAANSIVALNNIFRTNRDKWTPGLTELAKTRKTELSA